jgi:hypothetical protein
VNRVGVLGACVAAAGCGAGSGTRQPAPLPSPSTAAAPASPAAPIFYAVPRTLTYQLERRDSLVISSAGGEQVQSTAKQGVVTVSLRPADKLLEIRLDSLNPQGTSHLAKSTLDSAIGTRWRSDRPIRLGTSLTSDRQGILTGQVGQILELLFQQLPSDGLRSTSQWTTTVERPLHVDAFDAAEQATRSANAVPVSAATIAIDFTDQLRRNGTAQQADQLLKLTGTGRRTGRLVMRVDGYPASLEATETSDLIIARDSGPPILVRALTVIRAVLREPNAR